MKVIFFIVSLAIVTVAHAQIITTIAGNGSVGWPDIGATASGAQLGGLEGVAADKSGNIYIADILNALILKIDTNGVLTQFAGNGVYGFGADNVSATATNVMLYIESGIAADDFGNIYFADGDRVRMVNTVGIVTTVAGNGSYGSSGDGGPATAAELEAVTGICFDNAGDLYISSSQASNIRKVNTAGVISTFAGSTIGFSGDGGQATNAQMKTPEGIACDDSGNVYFADADVARIRKINTSGVITTIAGGDTSIPSHVCEGCLATSLQLSGPIGIAVDNSGNVFTSVIEDGTIHEITKDGLAYTIAGHGTSGFAGDGGPASAALLNSPKMISMDNEGNLLVCDVGNHRLRKIWIGTSYVPPLPHYAGSPQFSTYPNPVTNHHFTCEIITDTNEGAKVIVTDVLGRQVFSSSCHTNTATDFSINIPAGVYFVTATVRGYKWNKKIVVE